MLLLSISLRVLYMQRDTKKLAEAHYRRVLGKALIFLILLPLADYAVFFVSGGSRHIYGAEYWNLLMVLILILFAFIVMKPIYRLEWPYQYQLERHRKASESEES